MTRKQKNTQDLINKIASGVLKRMHLDNPHTIEKRLYSLREGAKYLGRSLSAIEKLVCTGELPSVKHGARRMLDKQSMDKWIADGRVQ